MSEHEGSGGGQPALAVSSAHLAELLGAIDHYRNQAMFLAGLNLASSSLFVALLASLDQPWWAAVVPIALVVCAVLVGLWVLRPTVVTHFPVPQSLLSIPPSAQDDELSWLLVQMISESAGRARVELARAARGAQALLVITLAQVTASIAIAGVLLA